MPTPKAHVASLAPYQLADLALAPGIQPVMLAQNESLRDPSPQVATAISAAQHDGRLYADPKCSELAMVLRQIYDLSGNAVLLGAGSMELIGVLLRAYVGPGDEVLSSQFGYAYFALATAITGARYIQACELDYTLDVDAMLAKVTDHTKVVVAVNPGNPTGTAIANSEIRRLRMALPEDVLLVIDEAYGEFTDAWQKPVFDLVEAGNCVVLRTLSKAYGLASMRVGWGFFPETIAQQMLKLLNPNRLSSISQHAAMAALQDQEYMRATVTQTLQIAQQFRQAMQALGFYVPQSHGNFVLLKLASATQAQNIEKGLRKQGFLVRPMRNDLAECLRITIGEPQVMRQLTEVITALCQQN